jgi:translocation and assembly module TamB
LAQITQASFSSSLIPVPLTNVQGKMDLNLDRILFENLTGQLNGGNFSLQGSLPILKTLAQKQPLQLTFRDLLLDLKGFYQGRAKGEIRWLGSLLEPSIGGHIELFNGQFLLENPLLEEDPWVKDPFKEKTAAAQGRSLPKFANFELILGENVLISRPPIVTVAATGNLLLNGPLAQPQPEGTILLKSGQVNLFANQLRLASSDNNTAQFSPKWGFDPYLNLRLVTAVSETNRNLVRTTPLSSEINDPFTANNDSLQTVRIQAQIKGLASQLTRSIELTSNPSRNRSEIITLLGGSFVNTLSSGDTTVGLANLAGTAVLGTVQGAIGDALGLSEFRIFSTPLINDQERIGSTQIGVAAEAGVDLTHDLSLSLLQILNADRPPQFGLRYRINENTILRGSSNFSDDNRGIIEYQRRF